MSCQRCDGMYEEMLRFRNILRTLLQRLDASIVDYENETCSGELFVDAIDFDDQVPISEGNLPAEVQQTIKENGADAVRDNDGNKVVEQNNASDKLAEPAQLKNEIMDELQRAMAELALIKSLLKDVATMVDEKVQKNQLFAQAAQKTQEPQKYVAERTMAEPPKKMKVEDDGVQAQIREEILTINCGYGAAEAANDANKLDNKNESFAANFAAQIGLKPENMKNNYLFSWIKRGRPIFLTFDSLKWYEQHLRNSNEEVKILRDFYRRFDYNCGHARWLHNVWTALISHDVLHGCTFDPTRRREGIRDTQIVEQMEECFRERYPEKCYLDFKVTTMALFKDMEYKNRLGNKKNHYKF